MSASRKRPSPARPSLSPLICIATTDRLAAPVGASAAAEKSAAAKESAAAGKCAAAEKSTRLKPVPFTAIALCALLLAGCARTGDLGRPAPSLWNDRILPFAGMVAAEARGEAVSWFMLTDDEQELRNRAWRFLMPAHEKAIFQRQLAELARTRILPREPFIDDPRAYLRPLRWSRGQSPAPLFNRIGEDAGADRALITPFVALARAVLRSDEARLQLMMQAGSLDEFQAESATARIKENRCLIAWVRAAAIRRTGEYRHALEQLAIEAPQVEAIAAEREVVALEAALGEFAYTGIPPLRDGRCETGSGAPTAKVSAPPPVIEK